DDEEEPRKKTVSRERHRRYVSERTPAPATQVAPQSGFFGGGGFSGGGWFGSATQYGGGVWGRCWAGLHRNSECKFLADVIGATNDELSATTHACTNTGYRFDCRTWCPLAPRSRSRVTYYLSSQ